MHELTCPSCGSAGRFNLEDMMHLCQFCSASFLLDLESGQKEVFSDHYVVPNILDGQSVKDTFYEWLKRIHHTANNIEQEFVLTELRGFSLPYWVVPLDAHTLWKGLAKRDGRNPLKNSTGAEYLIEKGEFRRSYRWAVSGRKNPCEIWGLTRLHVPKENIIVDWDGFPLDSTFTRGRLEEEKKKATGEVKSVYDQREFFDYKYSNGLPILAVQVSEDEALRRAKTHVELYHYRLSQTGLDYLLDFRCELEVTGVQLIHLPFWHCVYQYRPRSALKHFMKPITKNLVIEGCGRAVINGELAVTHNDKVYVNAVIAAITGVIFFLLGSAIHPGFFIVTGLAFGVAAISLFLANSRSKKDTGTALDPSKAAIQAWSNAEKATA